MTPRQLTQARAIATETAPLVERSNAKIDDALAHVMKAITDSVLNAPDGRATFAAVARSKSYAAALARLDELRASLPSLLQDARESFYRDAFSYWAASYPPDLLDGPDPLPTLARVAQCRAAPQHGLTIQQRISGPIRGYQARLKPAANLAGSRAIGKSDGSDVLKTWATQAKNGLASMIRLAVNDSWTLADNWAMRDVVHGDYLDDDPNIPDPA